MKWKKLSTENLEITKRNALLKMLARYWEVNLRKTCILMS